MTSLATLDPDAKEALRKTVRSLRDRLIADLHASTESEYRLSVKAEQAGLREAQRIRRKRLEDWLEEQVRTVSPKEQKEARGRFRLQAEKEAAYTLLHRVVLLRLMEAAGLSKPLVATGGWQSAGYREFREYAPELCGDESEGYGALLQLVFDELAGDLPGLFGDVGLTRLVPVRPETLRALVEALDAEALTGAWKDDTTLGWVYQFWNDPEREKLDAKIAEGLKIAPHEIASKTQMFTERYMVEWLLHNTLGQTWLAMCVKNGWTADARAVLDELDARRSAWRVQREQGLVPLDALMPIENELEDHWKYWVPQPLLADAIEKAPSTLTDLKLLDPACGSGHFLVIAFDLLASLYREEARHRNESLSEREIAERILEKNLHGVDIDPRCIQIAAAAVWLKAKSLSREASPRAMNLVAPALHLADLPKDDPALTSFLQGAEREVGLPASLTRALVAALAGADYLGSLLRVGTAIDELIATQPLLVRTVGKVDAKAVLLEKLETFLDAHASERDLGLRLDGEQLAAGVRFLRVVREGQYDIVVGNPPYQGLSKTERFGYVATHYKKGKDNLYAAFLERGLQLAKPGGLSALLTMRGWMFLGQFAELRKEVLHAHDLRMLGDVDRGAFADILDEVVSATMAVVRRGAHDGEPAIAIQPTALSDNARDSERTKRKRAALLTQVGRYEFDPRGFEVIEGEPIVYWWTKEFLRKYEEAPKLGEVAPVRQGLITSDNTRFVREFWELAPARLVVSRGSVALSEINGWVPYIKGAAGRSWFEPLSDAVLWAKNGLQIKTFESDGRIASRPQNEHSYLHHGVAFSPIGASFTARKHRFTSIFDSMGSSVFPKQVDATCCLMNSRLAGSILESLNPTVHFQVGDVNRLPVFTVAESDAIIGLLDTAFTQHEHQRESSIEFARPGPNAWQCAQIWAQRAVDRPDGSPLPPYEPVYEQPKPTAFVSFALGVALGRFGANGEGILEEAPASAFPAGILFLGPEEGDGLSHPATAPLLLAWNEHGDAVREKKEDDLRAYLQKSYFAYHKGLYENRPIYFPLSSAKKNYVAWVSIHRWKDDTLSILLADHLLPAQRKLEGEVGDLRQAKASTDKKQSREAEKRYANVQKWREELAEFIAKVEQLATQGAPPVDDKCTAREVDAPFHMDLDDGVMINSAALWPLLDPQWKDPKKWWRELATSSGKKDYDWSHLAKRYWPTRVDQKCKADPSLGVAHGCFWKYHPAKAYAWELRLQHEMEDPHFKIEEAASDEAREAFVQEHEREAEEIREKEQKRRARKAGKEDDAREEDARAAGDLFADAEESEEQ